MALLEAFDLTGKTAIVTGGNMGIGEAFAKALVEVGTSVALAARERSARVAEESRTPEARPSPWTSTLLTPPRWTGCWRR